VLDRTATRRIKLLSSADNRLLGAGLAQPAPPIIAGDFPALPAPVRAEVIHPISSSQLEISI
jgi:hypothetical protein